MSSIPRIRLLARAYQTSATPKLSNGAPSAILHNSRPFSQSSRRVSPYKDDQDRESLRPRAQETSKSGSDDEAAAHSDAAYNPSKTRPEDAKRSARTNGDPLEFSPANKEVSKSKGAEEEISSGSGKKAEDKKKPSGGKAGS